MRSVRRPFLAFLLVLVLAGPLPAAEGRLLFQTSTLQALLGGVYDGDLTYNELARHGDFGIGTFNALDGEMIALDGKFYQIRADGRAYPVNPSMKTPFAEVTFFKANQTHMLKKPLTYRQLTDYITSLLQAPISFMPSGSKDFSLMLKPGACLARTNPIRRWWRWPPSSRCLSLPRSKA
jgi:hypothetical protein